MARYLWNEKTHKLELIDSSSYRDPNKGLNGPVYFPKGGYGYFDKALNKYFGSLQEKKDYMRQNGLMMQGNDKNFKGVEAKGIGKTYYSFAGQKTCNRGYKYR